jgi:hypothetical protein
MITKQDIQNKLELGDYIAGLEKQPDFVVSSKSDISIGNAIFLTIEIENVLNQYIKLKNYVKNNYIESIFFVFLILPTYNGQGVEWQEKKLFKKNQKWLYLNIYFTDYTQFIDAKPQEALKLMATETLRGAKKFLSGVKDFNFERFYADVEDLFKRQGWV